MKTRTHKPRTMKPSRMWAEATVNPGVICSPNKNYLSHPGGAFPVLVIPLTGEAVEEMRLAIVRAGWNCEEGPRRLSDWDSQDEAAKKEQLAVVDAMLTAMGIRPDPVITAPRPAGEKDTTP